MSFTILTDTSCNLPDDLVHRFELEMVPLRYVVNGISHESYTDGKQADFKAFYDMLRSGVKVTTSLADRSEALSCAQRIVDRGDDILYLGFSSGLSGTYETVSTALAEIAQRHPERRIISVDTLAASAGQGLLITYVAQMREAGHTIDECADWAREHRFNIAHWFTVNDLMFLKRGGRVSSVSAVFGTALAIKPVMHVDNDGHLIVVSKVRGRRKSIQALADRFAAAAPLPKDMKRIVYISHGDCYDEAKLLADTIMERYDDPDHPMDYPLIVYVDPTIGAHSGPGTIALFFYDAQR